MKNILIIGLTFLSFHVSAQVDISNTTTNAAVELNVVSPGNNTGVLISRLTTAQMNAIASPINGLLVYNTDVGVFMYNAGDATTHIWAVLGQAPAIDKSTISAVGNQGYILFNSTDNKMYYSNGTSWIELVAP